MTIAEPVAVVVDGEEHGRVHWGAAVAGAIAATALAVVLQSFAAAIGLAVSSTSPTWRDSSATLHLLSGLYLLLAAIIAFGVGGYLAGRLRSPLDGSPDDTEFRDGVCGLLVWGIAVVLTVLLTWAAAQTLGRVAAPTSGSSNSAQSIPGESLIAYDLDRLFRAERRPQNVDLNYVRSEAARILLTSAGHTGIINEDRVYLVRLTAGATGLSAADAETRVNTVISQAREDIRKGRQAGVILAFMVGAAALVGAVVAWFAAIAGGEHRDGRSAPPSWLQLTRRR